MRVVFGMVLLAGVALAGGAVYMAKNYIGEYQQALANKNAALERMVKTIPVYVMERSIKYGEDLTKEDIREVQWPEDAIPEGAFESMEDLFPKGDDVVRVVLRPMEKDEAILALKVTEPGEDSGITSRLEKGMRAYTLRVDVSSGVSGFLRPGDRVDVYWTGRVQSGTREQTRTDVTKLIEAGIQLIAVDQSSNSDLSGATIASTVTIKGTPAQVAALELAQSTGRLSLSLVGSGDDSVAEAVEIDQNTLLGIVPEEKVAEVKQKEEEVCTIRNRRGGESVVVNIPCPTSN